MPARLKFLMSVFFMLSAGAASADSLSKPAAQWWADITALSGDSTEGRETGSSGYMRAADYVISRFKAEGLVPAGTQGYLQPVEFGRQLVDQRASSLDLVAANGAVTSLHAGEDSRIGAGGAPLPDHVDAPLVFVGYGLHLPKQGYDDFAGPIKSNARFVRTSLLGKMGAMGIIALTTPHQVEIPWSRQRLLATQPGMYLADASLRETPDGFFSAAVDPDKSEVLFAGSGHTFAELCAVADASKPLPHFKLPLRLTAHVVAARERLSSPNLIAKLPGRDRKLASQYVAISAHLDHLGIGAPINGDKIYHGAMDDASGVATVLDIADRLK